MTGWIYRAACRDAPPELFFPVTELFSTQIRRAKKMCRRCPVAEACLAAAVDEGDVHGIRGGLTPGERRRARIQDRGGVRDD